MIMVLSYNVILLMFKSSEIRKKPAYARKHILTNLIRANYYFPHRSDDLRGNGLCLPDRL